MGWSRLWGAGCAEGRNRHSFPQRAAGRSRNPGSWALSSGRDWTPRHETPQDLQMQGTGQLPGLHPDPQGLTAVCQCSAQGAGDTPRVFKGDCMLAATSTQGCEPALLVRFEVQPSPSLVNITKRGFALPRCCSQVERPTGEKKKKERAHARSPKLLGFYFQNCSLVKVLTNPFFQLYIWGGDAGVGVPASIRL